MKRVGGKIVLLSIIVTLISTFLHFSEIQIRENEYQIFYEDRRNKALSQGGISVAEFDEILAREAEYKKNKSSDKSEMKAYDYGLILLYFLACAFLILKSKVLHDGEKAWVPIVSSLVMSFIYGNEIVIVTFIYLLLLFLWKDNKLTK